MKTKNLLMIALTILIASGCKSTMYFADYNIGLSKVSKVISSKIEREVNISDKNLTYSDSIITINWKPTKKKFGFDLTNETNKTIKIIWDEAVIVLFNGQSNRAIHTGVKYINRNSSQPPSIIIADSKISDFIVPSDNISWRALKYSPGNWKSLDIYFDRSFRKEELVSKSKSYSGGKIMILLPISLNDRKIEYTFVFNFDEPKFSQRREFNHKKTMIFAIISSVTIGGAIGIGSAILTINLFNSFY